RKSHGKSRADVWGAVHGDAAVVTLDDAVADAQPESGSHTRRFGGEERLEDALLYVLRHSLTRVGDRDVDFVVLLPRHYGEVPNVDVLHRVFGVDEKVKNDLLKLLVVTAHLRAARIEVSVNFDSAREGSVRTEPYR